MFGTNGKPRKPAHTPATNVGGGLAGLISDVITLMELQAKLLAVDAKESTARMIAPIGLIAGGVVFALAALPLGLIAIAQVLRDQAGLAPALATLLALLMGLVIGGLLGLVGYVWLRRSLRPLSRSQEECQRNLEWFKTCLQRLEDRPPSSRERSEQAAPR